MDFFDYMMAALALAMIIIGIASLIGFFITGMWHCLFIALIDLGMVYIWYYEDYYSKGKSIWQRKSTKK